MRLSTNNLKRSKTKVEKRLERWCKKHKFLSKFKFIVSWKAKIFEKKIRKAIYQMYHYRSIVVDESLTTAELIKEITPKFYEIEDCLSSIYNILESNTNVDDSIYELESNLKQITDENGNFDIEKYKEACIRDKREKSLEEQDFDTGDNLLENMDDEILFSDDDDTYM